MNIIKCIEHDFFNENIDSLINMNRYKLINLLFLKSGLQSKTIDEITEFIINSKNDIYDELKLQNEIIMTL